MGSTSGLLPGKRKHLRCPFKQKHCNNYGQKVLSNGILIIMHGQVDGEQLLDLDMKKFRQEKQEV